MHDIEAAKKKAAAENKDLFIDFCLVEATDRFVIRDSDICKMVHYNEGDFCLDTYFVELFF